MGVPEITASNVAALMAAFRSANAPEPADRTQRPADPAARGRPAPLAAFPRPAPAQEPSIRVASARAAMTRALFDAAELRAPQPPLRQSALAYAAALQNRTVEIDSLLAHARSVLNLAAPEPEGGVRSPVPDALFAALDRRALFAVATGLGGLFSKAEREGARNWLFRLGATLLARLETAASAAERIGVLSSFIDQLDGAGPEERATAEWVVQRAAAALGRDRLATGAGMRPPDDPEAGNPRLATVRAALEAPERVAMKLPEGLPPAAGAREAPLLGTVYLTPDMLLVGLAAALKAIDRRRASQDRRPPAGADWRDEPDEAPAEGRDPDAADESLDLMPAEDEDGADEWEDAADEEEGEEEDGFEPGVDR